VDKDSRFAIWVAVFTECDAVDVAYLEHAIVVRSDGREELGVGKFVFAISNCFRMRWCSRKSNPAKPAAVINATADKLR
jgi:hypothetical protein